MRHIDIQPTPWDQWYEGRRLSNYPSNSYLQSWVSDLPLRFQGVLVTACRGCDTAPKMPLPADDLSLPSPSLIHYVADNGRDVSPERQLTAYLRWLCFTPADPREVGVPGAFFQNHPPENWKPSAFGHYPEHWYAHIMHGYEVAGYEYPLLGLRKTAHDIYLSFVKNLHLNPETREQLWTRLTEDRIATGTVVS